MHGHGHRRAGGASRRAPRRPHLSSEPVRKAWPSGSHAQAVTLPECASYVCRHAPLSVSHIFTWRARAGRGAGRVEGRRCCGSARRGMASDERYPSEPGLYLFPTAYSRCAHAIDSLLPILGALNTSHKSRCLPRPPPFGPPTLLGARPHPPTGSA